jgi:hypothetical protein
MSRVSEDVMELVQLLSEEGFAILAGELLTEIGLGREPDESDWDEEAPFRYDQANDHAEGDVGRVPFGPDTQLDFALESLQLRLVAPARALAEAEAIAGDLAVPDGEARMGTDADGIGRPITLAFRSLGRSSTTFSRDDEPGSTFWADSLSAALTNLRKAT